MDHIPKHLMYQDHFTIRTYEIDRARRVTVASLINLMQEAAVQNVMELNLSVWDLAERHMSWVLVRKNLQILRMPQLNETIRVVTYPAGFDRLFTYRDYLVYDANNELIAKSSSAWLLMNTQTRKMERVPQEIKNRGDFDTSLCLEKPINKLPALDRIDLSKDFDVHWHDTDFNNHLSNIRYMQWTFETIDFYLENKGRLKSLDIIYKSECFWKDTVRVMTQQIDDRNYRHALIRLSDEKELARVSTSWDSYTD